VHDEPDPDERALTDGLKAIAMAVKPRQPERVVEQVLVSRAPTFALGVPRRSAAIVTVALVFVLVIGAVSIGYLNSQGASSLATATVGGVEYNLAAARNLNLPKGLLEPYGTATNIQVDADLFSGTAVFAIRGIDPASVLVLKLQPDARDDAGSLGEYFLLIRGPNAFRSLCPYFDPSSETSPRVCR